MTCAAFSKATAHARGTPRVPLIEPGGFAHASKSKRSNEGCINLAVVAGYIELVFEFLRLPDNRELTD